MGFLRAAASRVTSTVSRAASSATRNVQRAASSATRNVQRAASGAARNVNRAASSFAQGARRAASNATRSAQRTLSSVSRNVQRTASGAASNVRRAASSATRNVSRAFSGASRNVQRAASSATRQAQRAFSGAQRRVGSTLSSATSGVRRAASSTVRNTQRAFSSVTRNAQRTASTVSRNVSRSFSQAQRQVGSTLSNATRGVTRRATNLANNVGRTVSRAAQGTQRAFSSAARNTQRTFSTASSNVSRSVSTAGRNIRNGVSQAARNTLNAAGQAGQRTLSAAGNTARRTLNGYHNLIEQSYQDAKVLQKSSNPFERAVGNYSVGVRDGIAKLNRTVDNSIEYWKGVKGPVGRAGQFLASTGKAFTSPLRAVDHTATRQQRNGALIETGVSLATAGAGKLVGPAMRGLANTPVGKATVRQLGRLGNTPVGRSVVNQFSRLSQTAARVNNAPAQALGRSKAGQTLLRTEANVRRQLSRANHFGNSQAARNTSGAGYYQVRERKTSVPNAERLTGPASARQPQTSSYCGHACVSNVNRTNGGRNVSMWDLTRTNPPGPDGLDIHEVSGMLNGLGHKARPVQSQNILQFGRAIQDSGSPAVLLRNGHFITIDSVENGMVYFRDPLAGSYRAPITSFSDKYHGVVVDR